MFLPYPAGQAFVAIEITMVDESDIKMSPADLEKYKNEAKASGKRACKPRVGSPYAKMTGGALWAFCACGHIAGFMVLPQAESTRMVVLFLIRLFGGGYPMCATSCIVMNIMFLIRIRTIKYS